MAAPEAGYRGDRGAHTLQAELVRRPAFKQGWRNHSRCGGWRLQGAVEVQPLDPLPSLITRGRIS
jgi:hypothetical protein